MVRASPSRSASHLTSLFQGPRIRRRCLEAVCSLECMHGEFFECCTSSSGSRFFYISRGTTIAQVFENRVIAGGMTAYVTLFVVVVECFILVIKTAVCDEIHIRITASVAMIYKRETR